MDKMNNQNRIIAMNENENGFINTNFTPHQYLHFLLEQTVDDVLVIPGKEDEASYTCYDMDWNEKKYEMLCNEFDELTDSLKKIADGEDILEVWETYVKPFNSEKFDSVITEELLQRDNLDCNDITDEEQTILDKYHAAKAEEYRNRLGGNVLDANEIVYAQRLCKLYEMNAPEIIIRNEERCLIESMAINRYAFDYI